MRPDKNRIPYPRRLGVVAVGGALAVGLAACGSSGSGASSPSGSPSPASAPSANKKPLTLDFGSSGAAETAAIKKAAAAFTKASGIPVSVRPAANLTQELAQDFAGNAPPNLFYLDPGSFQEYVKKGVLADYAQSLPNAKDFFPSLASAFTYKGQLVCAPKDGSALSLYINNAMWKAAGLTSYPTNWSQLASDAKKLTTSAHAGLTLDPSSSRIDAFFYQAGGSIFNKANTKAVLDSPANLKALTFLKGMLSAGTLKFPSQLNQGGGTDALGAKKAAMAITGNWMDGAMKSDYPSVSYSVHSLPAGPTGTKGTLTFTNCWGVAKQNNNLGGTVKFVKFLTSPGQELAFAKEFGPVPSLQTISAQYTKAFPKNAPVLDGLKTGHPDIALAGSTQAVTAFSSALAQLGSTDPKTILSKAQQNFQGVISQNG